jgi:hypothetical protein
MGKRNVFSTLWKPLNVTILMKNQTDIIYQLVTITILTVFKLIS